MKITLDEKQCLKNNLTLQEALIALAVRAGKTKDALNNLILREVM